MHELLSRMDSMMQVMEEHAVDIGPGPSIKAVKHFEVGATIEQYYDWMMQQPWAHVNPLKYEVEK